MAEPGSELVHLDSRLCAVDLTLLLHYGIVKQAGVRLEKKIIQNY